MRQADRLSVILEDLSEGGSVSVTELCRRLGVSAATIRRDLGLLEEHRLLRRTHGGAVSQGLLYELPLRYKTARHQEEKRRIAHAAAELVPEGAAIGLTGGTTTTVTPVLVEMLIWLLSEGGRRGGERSVTVITDAVAVREITPGMSPRPAGKTLENKGKIPKPANERLISGAIPPTPLAGRFPARYCPRHHRPPTRRRSG